MKQLYATIVLLGLISLTTSVKAAQCRSSPAAGWTTVVDGGAISLTSRVDVVPTADATRILFEGSRLECRFTPGRTPEREDYWRTAAAAWTPGPKFASQSTGLRIHGVDRNSPVPAAVWIATMPDNSMGYPLNVIPYILTRNQPTNPIDVAIGDVLGTLTLIQTNNYSPGSTTLNIRYISNNFFGVSPSTCTINNNNPLVIDFGDVNQRAIGTDPLTSSIRTTRTLNYSCPGPGSVTSPITITYKGISSSFNANLLTMNNPDVGTALVRGGSAVPVNGSFRTQITNNAGRDDVTFSLVSRGGSLPAAGIIFGSGVIVMGVP